MSRLKPPIAILQHYWLVSGEVHFTLGDNTALHHKLNAIVKTGRHGFAHVNMAKAQQLLQMRLVNEQFPEGPPAGFQIMDVYLAGVSHLGMMTEKQFAEGFEELAAEQSKAAELLEKIRKEAAATA